WRDPKTKSAWVTSLAIGLIVPVFNALQGTGSVHRRLERVRSRAPGVQRRTARGRSIPTVNVTVSSQPGAPRNVSAPTRV
ncbi:transporter, partial [Streptomyces sp. NPDC005732]